MQFPLCWGLEGRHAEVHLCLALIPRLWEVLGLRVRCCLSAWSKGGIKAARCLPSAKWACASFRLDRWYPEQGRQQECGSSLVHLWGVTHPLLSVQITKSSPVCAKVFFCFFVFSFFFLPFCWCNSILCSALFVQQPSWQWGLNLGGPAQCCLVVGTRQPQGWSQARPGSYTEARWSKPDAHACTPARNCGPSPMPVSTSNCLVAGNPLRDFLLFF